MTQPSSPSRNYHRTALVAACAGGGSLFLGDDTAMAGFKALMALPFGLAWVCLPELFDRQRSLAPLTRPFIERTLIEALLFTLGLALVLWQPGRSLDSLVATTLAGTAAVFAAKTLALVATDLWLKRRTQQ
jgi:hypothetical protein